MIERDYIMRMIALLTAAITKILRLKKEKDYPEALREADVAMRSLAGIDAQMLEVFSDDQLMEMFGRDPEIAPVRWYVVGRLLAERGELCRLTGDETRAGIADRKALSLLLHSYLAPDMAAEPDHRQIIDTLIQRVDQVSPNSLPWGIVGQYQEKVRSFAKAEDCYWMILERDPGAARSVLEFYERLKDLPDTDLTDGGLPREEVQEGMERVRRLLG